MPPVIGVDALQLAVDAAAATQELANLASFVPVAIAAGILLEIFRTIQKIQSNKAECERLASRCLTILGRARDQMDGRWEDAPPSLLKALKTFEATLESVHVFLACEASKDWRTRLGRKRTIEKALNNFAVRLDDAERSFQIATLINIHYAVGDKKKDTTSQLHDPASTLSIQTFFPPKATCSRDVFSLSTQGPVTGSGTAVRKDSDMSDSSTLVGSATSEGFAAFSPISEECSVTRPGSAAVFSNAAGVTDYSKSLGNQRIHTTAPSPKGIVESPMYKVKAPAHKFQPVVDGDGSCRYHQSDMVLRGRSRIQEGWWAGAAQADIDGQRVLVKRYEGPRDTARERWRHDVEVFRRVCDADLAHMLGYSQDACSTPFIVLASNPTQLPQGLA
ncbi:hypothetical protein DAEQUDRAFT_769356 [Daedalea quercina L-15889]|uniref:Uncharacterized protein n=1 Tax=Daedalea quercina L-15889 TaxID=1314783 RepID=A0A165LU73_9APHY|nr:hypothetical protein DAEQUDRAFT_769356 [Daedalea quercina L-15889]